MKDILKKVPVTIILLVSYISLVVILGITRISESRTIRKTNASLTTLMDVSKKRQVLHAGFLNSIVSRRVLVLTLIYQSEPDSQTELISKIGSESNNILQYMKMLSPLITDPGERILLDSLSDLNLKSSQNRDHVIRLAREQKINEARRLDIQQLQSLFIELQRLELRLSDQINLSTIEKEKTLKSDLHRAERFSYGMTAVITVLLFLFGIVIYIISKFIISRKNKTIEIEKRYRVFLEQSHDIVDHFDADGKILYASDNLKEMLGYSDRELRELKITDLVPGYLAEKLHSVLSGIEEKNDLTNIVVVLKSKDGRKNYLSGNLIWEYKDGRFAGGTGFFKDITEEFLLKKSLKESELKFRQLFNHAPIPMYVFDPESYRFLQVNEAAENLYGFTNHEFLRENLLNLRPDEEKERTKKAVSLIIRENAIYTQNYKHLKKDGTPIDVEVYASRIVLNDKPLVLASILDVTEKKLIANRINEAILKTQEDERYEIGGELHDNVCQLLAAATMGLSRVKQVLPDQIREVFNNSVNSINTASDEIRNLSHRLAPVIYKSGSLHDSLESLLSSINFNEDYEISFYFDESLSENIISQELRLNIYRIVQEQLRNIIKYAKASEIKIELLLYKKSLYLRIGDNGIGFDTGKTTSGIGLANMRRRSEYFSGKMEIQSSPGNGCEIMIVIPLDAAISNNTNSAQTN